MSKEFVSWHLFSHEIVYYLCPLWNHEVDIEELSFGYILSSLEII